LNLQKHSLKGQLETKLPVNPTWSKKMIVLKTFLESSLNLLSNNIRNTKKMGTVREKSCVKFELTETQFEWTET